MIVYFASVSPSGDPPRGKRIRLAIGTCPLVWVRIIDTQSYKGITSCQQNDVQTFFNYHAFIPDFVCITLTVPIS